MFLGISACRAQGICLAALLDFTVVKMPSRTFRDHVMQATIAELGVLLRSKNFVHRGSTAQRVLQCPEAAHGGHHLSARGWRRRMTASSARRAFTARFPWVGHRALEISYRAKQDTTALLGRLISHSFVRGATCASSKHLNRRHA